MDIKTFRNSPLSHYVVTALTHAAMAQSEWKTILKVCEPSNAVRDLLTLSEIRYHSMYMGSTCAFDDALVALYVNKKTDSISKDIHVLQECILYAKHKISETKVLTAADLIKINEAISTSDTKILEAENPQDLPLGLVNDIWGILHDLYNPAKQYPLLLEVAIAVYRLSTLQQKWGFDLWVFCVLLETLYTESFEMFGISLQWLILVDPEKSLCDYDIDHAIVLLFSIFENIWRYNSNTYLAVIDEERKICETIQELLPKICTDKVLVAITKNIYLNNTSFRDNTGVSHGTAVNYLKELERIGVLSSIVNGRERLYFNKAICDFALEQWQVM